MQLKAIFFTAYLIITSFIFLTVDAESAVVFSFVPNALVLTFFTYYHLYIEKIYSPFLSTYIVFNYLFFIVAPMSQLTTLSELGLTSFSNKFEYKQELFLKTNLLVFLFHIVFFTFYIGAKRLIKTKEVHPSKLLKKGVNVHVAIFILLSFLVIILNWSFIQDELTRPSWLVSEYSVSDLLIRKKVLFVLPLAGILLAVNFLYIQVVISKKG